MTRLLMHLTLLLLLTAAAESAHVRIRHSHDRHANHDHDHSPQATPAAAAMATTTNTTTNSTAMSSPSGVSRRATAAVKFASCPERRTLTDGCVNATSEELTCVTGGQWHEVAALSLVGLKGAANANKTNTCTNAFFVKWIKDPKEEPTSADASGLRIQTVDSFQRTWTALYAVLLMYFVCMIPARALLT